MRKKFIGILMIVITLTILVIWELWGEELILYDEVIALKNDISEGTIITSDMFKTIKVEKTNERALKPDDIEKLCQMQARSFIPKDEKLYSEYFQPNIFSHGTNTNLSVLSIPSGWLVNMPQSIKRGDRAFFYADGKIILEATVIHVKSEDNTEIKYSDVNRLNASGIIGLIEILITPDQIETICGYANNGEKLLMTYK